MSPRILHIDMDAFYASVEQVDYPELIAKPVIIGGSKRGVVAAASYEARKFGVRSAMPIFEAKRLCPHGVFLPVRRRRYQEVSHEVMEILDTMSPLVEQVSIDEAFIDITGTESLHGPEIALIGKIKDEIRKRTSLTCSIGIAPNRFLAKIASEMNALNAMNATAADWTHIEPLLDEAMPQFEKTLIHVALKHTQGHRQAAAKLLGWGRNTLTRKLKELGMDDIPE